jgi:hypothetical protein
LSQLQEAKILQDEILSNHLCEEKEMEKELQKMHSELQKAKD